MGLVPEHVGIFAGADGNAHVQATKELTLVSAISASPILIGLIAFLIIKPAPFGPSAGATDYLSAILLRGQLFLISVSFMATSLQRLYNSDRSYRRPDIINLFSMLLFGVIGVFYGINPSFSPLKDPTTRILSIVFILLSILFYYYTAVLAYERPASVEKTLHDSSERLSEKLTALRSEGAE